MSEQMTMDTAELVSLIRDYLLRSDSGSGSTLSLNRRQATDYYLGRLDGRAPEPGLSQQLGGDVADMDFYFGIPGDIPIVGDFNNDGCDTVGIYRNGRVFIKNSLGTGPAERAHAV